MTRICVIGNSHLAALKLGWDAIKPEFSGIDLTFFGSAGAHIRELTVADGLLITTDRVLLRSMQDLSGGLSQIDPGCYDRFLVCGMEFSVSQVMRVAAKFRPESHARDNRHPISDECFRLSVIGCLRESLMIQTVEKLRQITDKPIAALPTPMRSDEDQRPVLRHIQTNGDDEKIAAAFTDAARHVATEFNVRLFLQPGDTLANCLQTKAVYRQGSVRLRAGLNVESAQGDYRHMNKAYGELVLRSILSGWDTDGRKLQFA
jgi:hypothetical protein